MTGKRIRSYLPSSRALSLAAFAFLLFSAGAAIMQYRIFPYSLYQKAFSGGAAWYDHAVRLPAKEKRDNSQPLNKKRPTGVIRHDPQRALEGYTLITVPRQTKAQLIDMEGKVVHEWSVPNAKAFPDSFRGSNCKGGADWSRIRLLPDGDLLVIYDCNTDTPSGYGFARIDKDSNVVWTADITSHHDFDVAPDGSIYVLTSLIRRKPLPGLDLPTPMLVDSITHLSPEGKVLEEVPILEAFRDSPYAALLKYRSKRRNGDFLHPNSVQVVTKELAGAFPELKLKPGQVLVSLCLSDMLAVLDMRERTITWAKHSKLWKHQHDAQFLPSGVIQLFNNRAGRNKSLIMHYDPRDDRISWSYGDNPRQRFFSGIRGMQQVLANGNLLINQSVGGRLIEITRESETVWEYYYPYTVRPTGGNPVVTALRYTQEELPFLSE